MKIVKKNISAKDGSGTILLRPETPEDLWHSYNLLRPGDLVRCTTVRKIVRESATGSTTSSKKRCMLTIRLRSIDFDPDVLQVRLSGVVCVETQNNLVRLGAHHRLTLELHQNFGLEKDCWDRIDLDLIEEACNPDKQAELAAVVMHSGLAHVCLVSGSLTITKARIETNIPKKRTGSSNNTKAIAKFYESVYQALLRHVSECAGGNSGSNSSSGSNSNSSSNGSGGGNANTNTTTSSSDTNNNNNTKIKAILIGSPGYVKDDFYAYLKEQCYKRDDRPFMDAVFHKKFVLAKASSGHKQALEEVFSDPLIAKTIESTKVVLEVAVLQKFMRAMDTDPDTAYYGYHHVKSASDQLAIDSLLVTDQLFRSSSVQTRRSYVDLVEAVRANGGTVYVFSTMHVSGQQLQQVSGVAAILRYPLPDLDELELQAEEYENNTRNGSNNNNNNGNDNDSSDDDGCDERVRQDLELLNF